QGPAARPGDEHEVLGLYVAVDDALLVCLLEHLADRREERDDLALREELAAAEERVEALALEELHDDPEEAVVGLAAVEDLDRVGVPQAAHGQSLAAEALAILGAAGGGGVQDLDRDLALQLWVIGLVDRAGPALPQLAHQGVLPPDDSPEQRILPPGLGRG